MRRVLGTLATGLAIGLATGSTAFGILLACRSLAHAETPPQSNCYADDDCFPEAPHCEIATGQCRPCLVDDHCGADYVCHQYECIPKCVSDTDCVAPEGYCSPEGVCLECLEDAHCPVDEPLCLTEPGVGECVACIVDEDCSGDTPWCNGSNTCVACLDHADCPEAQHCAQAACVADVCEPGASSCSDDRYWVIQCDEYGARETNGEYCPNADCEDGACGSPAGTGSEGTDTDAGTSAGQDDGTDETGDPGVGSPDGRGCNCDVAGEDSPLGAMGLGLLALFGWRARRWS